jgi:S1-C subfamily serine protease
MKLLARSLMILVATLTVQEQAPTQTTSNLRQDVIAASVKVQNQLRQGSVSVSGTIVGKTSDGKYYLVLTCKHLFEQGVNALNVIVPDTGKRYPAQWYGADERADLAILLIPAQDELPTLRLGERTPAFGAKVWQVGYPRGQGPIPREGVYLGSLDGDDVYRMTVAPGDSGSGVFSTAGELIGVVIAGIPEGPQQELRTALAVPLPAIREFVQRKTRF